MDWKAMYLKLLNDFTDAVNLIAQAVEILKAAQIETEAMFISQGESGADGNGGDNSDQN